MKEDLRVRDHKITNPNYRDEYDRIFNKAGDTVILTCPTCGETAEVNKYCKATGHVVGKGWTYICPNCHDSMEVLDGRTG